MDLRHLNPLHFSTSGHPVEEFLDWCATVGLTATPVTGRDRNSDYREAIARSCRRSETGACIRLRGGDLGAGMAGIAALIRELDLPKTQIDVVLDLQDIPVSNWFVLGDVAIRYLRAFEPLAGWRSTTVLGSSFPSGLYQQVEHNSFASIPRVENDLWRRIRNSIVETSDVSFGDYGVVDAAPQPGFRGAANLRYTLPSQWLVLRGAHPDKAPPDDYSNLARELVNLDGWQGRKHCPGCAFIAEHADGGRTGNSTQWRQAAFAHHFAVVFEALTAV